MADFALEEGPRRGLFGVQDKLMEAPMPATFLTSALGNFARNIARRGSRPIASLDFDRMSAHDLQDLNLPSELRSRVDARRELSLWDRAHAGFRG